MKAPITLTHEFVESFPDKLEEGKLYVSVEFATIAHSCPCGCRNQVITPLSPAEWQLTFDGETISLRPSVGNWSFDCQSHYWINKNKVRWAEQWSQQEIDAGRHYDRHVLDEFFAQALPTDVQPVAPQSVRPDATSLFKKISMLWAGFFRQK